MRERQIEERHCPPAGRLKGAECRFPFPTGEKLQHFVQKSSLAGALNGRKEMAFASAAARANDQHAPAALPSKLFCRFQLQRGQQTVDTVRRSLTVKTSELRVLFREVSEI